jgi:hypothetical protein
MVLVGGMTEDGGVVVKLPHHTDALAHFAHKSMRNLRRRQIKPD